MITHPAGAEPRRPVGADELRALMRHWPTGVTVVTTLDHEVPVGCTVNAMMSVSLSPPLLVVSLARTSATLEAIVRAGAFGLNVLAAHQERLCRQFARGTPRERFRGLAYRLRHRQPVLGGVEAAAACSVHDTMTCGDHVLVVGEPVWIGEPDNSPGVPLVFHAQGYCQLVTAVAARRPA